MLSRQLDPPYNALVFSLFFVANLVLVYWFTIAPIRFSNAFRDVAREGGFDFQLVDGAPHVLGSHDGCDFAISVVTQPARNFLGYRTECVATCSIERGVPSGFRLHHRAELSWYHELSGSHEINVGALSKSFMVEGKSIDQTREYCDAHTDVIESLYARYPRFLVSGADPFQISDVESERGVLTVVIKRTSERARIRSWISDMVESVKKLESS